MVASPQIRNQGTLGGNVSQDARCWYYRAGWPCYRAGGNICYADTPEGRNREHAILHADRCVAVNPSDSAPALIALDAKFVMRTPKGERVVDAEDYFIGPEIDITRLHILQPGDLLTAIRIPSTWAGAQFYFEKVRDRNVWDFPLLNVASAMVVSGGSIDRIRIAVNGAAARPLRLEGGRRCRSGQTTECRNRRNGGETGGAGSRAPAVQRLQDPADEEPGEARHWRRGGGNMDILEWATRSVGAACPHPYCVVPDLGCGDCGIALLDRSRHLRAIFRQDQGVCGRYFAGRRGAHARACSQTFAGRAAVSLDHGRRHVHIAVHRLPAEGRHSVSTG